MLQSPILRTLASLALAVTMTLLSFAVHDAAAPGQGSAVVGGPGDDHNPWG